ncbi:hypothetical protein BU16DRAFT_566907 [Lophium mytilinum]|uniref:Serine/threonine-protein kinase Tel1 n=1 Tax=Lophium mytilinum TaxID=390894 RepID=A0A6A6QBM9_9PEZI|nr:hypothetical protein BU16DRAFT_566907 [Lophium mytilinum]
MTEVDHPLGPKGLFATAVGDVNKAVEKLTSNNYSRLRSELSALNLEAFNDLLDDITSRVVDDRPLFLRGKSSTTAAKTRLRLRSKALRLVVSHSLSRISSTWISDLITHIDQAVRSGSEGFVAPLLPEYPQTLRVLVASSTIVERLSERDRNTALDLCTELLPLIVERLTGGSASTNGRSIRSASESLYKSSSVATSKALDEESKLDFRISANAFLWCLGHIVGASNAPVFDKDRSERILSAAIACIETRTLDTKSGFQLINSLLKLSTLDSGEFTRSAVRRLIPLLKSFWSLKEIREELLIMLIYTDAYISAMIQPEDEESFKLDLTSLLETMQADYKKNRLSHEVLCFRYAGRPVGARFPIGTLAFTLHSEHEFLRSDACISWMNVFYISHLASMLDSQGSRKVIERERDDETAAKRPRVEHRLHEYLREASDRRLQTATKTEDTRDAALSVISFMVQERPLNDEDLLQVLETLNPLITHDTPGVSAWALIGLTATAFQTSSKSSKFTAQWESIWQTAARTITSDSSSRAACHLMNVVLRLGLISYESISEVVERVLPSVELNGPALLTESSSSLWTTLLRGRTEGNPTLFNETSERILQWLYCKWTPSLFSERSYAEPNSLNCNSRDVLRLIAACLDRPSLPASGSSFAVLKPIGTAWLHAQSCRKLTDYLLLFDESLPFQSKLDIESFASDVNASQPTSHLLITEARVFDFLVSELEKTQQKWRLWTTESPQSVTQNMLRIVATLGFVCSALCYTGSPSQIRRVQKLEPMLEAFLRSFSSLFSRRLDDKYKLDTVLHVFAQAAPDINQITSLDPKHFRESGIGAFASHMSKALETQKALMESFYTEDIDFMDIDDGPDSQMTDETSTRDRHVSRHDLTASTSLESLRSSCSAYLSLIACVVRSPMDEETYNIIPPGFVNYLTSISPADLLHCRQFVSALISGPGRLQKATCQALLDHIGAEVMRQNEYQTSEVAEGMVLELLIGTESLWTDGGSKDAATVDLYATGQDFYEWFLGGYDEFGWAKSTNLQIGIANLCLCLSRSQPEFAQSLSLPSVRTSLFMLLADSDIPVQYHIAQCLPDMFNNFVLATHDSVFADIHESLPNKDRPEDIAIRLLVLSRLGSSWHTLLRRCVYLIFETAGLFESAMAHATRCISNVSESIKLGSSQELFRIFAPQMIYSWLKTGKKFADIPFLAFNYDTLLDLIEDVEDEAFGQSMMFAKEDELEYLAKLSKQSIQEGLKRNFAKAAAYSISWDTCSRNGNNKTPSNDARLQTLLEREQYSQLFHWHFPRIVGIVIYSMDNEDLLEKRLAKRPPYINTSNALKEIKTTSHSSQDLPEGIAPAFTAKYLSDQIERLCRRVSMDPVSFWTAEIFVFVMRMLLDRIHPALGSLHACSIIRKIRVLVGLAGPIALDGYPLQMTLQSLRPFLTDSQCAEDTLGVMQYLFERGKPFLSSQLSFVTGIGLSILTSIRVFLGSTQESTTQESQYQATMDRAKTFHSWFTAYLESYSASTQSSKSLLKAFKSIIRAASQTRIEGNANAGTAESRLLQELLDDERSERSLLSGPSREIAFNLLCQNFQPPKSMQDDIMGTDEQAVRFAPQVWQSCQRAGVGDGYLIWAARVLGRAFGAHGELERGLRVASIERSGSYTLKKYRFRNSRAAIFHSLAELLLSDDRKEMGLAESTIRLTLTKTKTAEQQSELDQILPQALSEYISTALTLPLLYTNPTRHKDPHSTVKTMAHPAPGKTASLWIRDLTVNLCEIASQDPLLGSLSDILQGIEGYPEKLFPFILHLVLHQEFDGQRSVRDAISRACLSWFEGRSQATVPYIKTLIRGILYLRTQPVPHEITREDRDRWLDINYLKAAEAATTCGMYKTALLFAETHAAPHVRSSRRSSTLPQSSIPTQLQFTIYRNLDEPDSFYGVEEEPSLPSILSRLDYENNGIKSLLFRGALMDSQMRQTNSVDPTDSRGMIKSFIILNLNSVTHHLLSNEQFHNTGPEVVNNTLHTARKLEQWDIRAPQTNHSEASTIFKAFQGLHYASDSATARTALDSQLLATIGNLVGRENSSGTMKASLRTLAVLAEVDDCITASDPDQLTDAWSQMQSRLGWMQNGQFDDVRMIMSCRETLFSVLSSNAQLQSSLRVTPRDIRHKEIAALLSSSEISRKHGAWQESLASATYLSSIVPQCTSVGLNIEALAEHEVANVLWEQGETETSIRIRQRLLRRGDLSAQSDTLSVSILLVKLGHHMAEARLEKPEVIIKNYLKRATAELKGERHGSEPGKVFHEFASFCDKQLHDPDSIDDLTRMKTAMERKSEEVAEYENLARLSRNSKDKERYKKDAGRSKKWQELDSIEYEKLRTSREDSLRQCLENYLLALQACDNYDHDVLRVFSLWLEYAEIPLANEAVGRHLPNVPSGKFAVLMNQLSSRLQAEDTEFQALLAGLVFRLCADHPYHGMHQIYAGAMPSPNKDDATRLRIAAAKNISGMLKNDSKASVYWSPLEESNNLYHELAMAKTEADKRVGREQYLEKHPQGRKLMQRIPGLKVPPATISLDIRPNCDYSDVPKITKFRNQISIANGLSAPKIVTAFASDGKPYKQLFKSGNDDLRQDAIMEQVFEQTSGVLKNHPATRTRNLHIRTYKVVPLSPRSGLMEFVPNTMALHTYLIPAHEKYYPKDLKNDACRRAIADVSTESNAVRVRKYKEVTQRFNPVMRYFFLERFEDPDDWFEKRLAYTRSTAAISILGHVLGLGDRHCHNILLDEQSGEVVHIDLGIAFEAGRVLPVPEVVPFRLTRDLIDGMGYTKTEGVFRRCCEFTLDALREEREGIMTLLNVLRYDPLVNWSLSVSKAKRLQDGQGEGRDAMRESRASTLAPGGDELVVDQSSKKEDDTGEAGRALSVVEKKLSKTLSTAATVNELIQQATDERNLAVLFCGWSAYV